MVRASACHAEGRGFEVPSLPPVFNGLEEAREAVPTFRRGMFRLLGVIRSPAGTHSTMILGIVGGSSPKLKRLLRNSSGHRLMGLDFRPMLLNPGRALIAHWIFSAPGKVAGTLKSSK